MLVKSSFKRKMSFIPIKINCSKSDPDTKGLFSDFKIKLPNGIEILISSKQGSSLIEYVKELKGF